jgi:O-antigen/teichoic acid export membrane protein
LTEGRRLGGAIASNYVALLAQIGFLLAMTPYVIDRRGADGYGAWAIVLAVAGYLRLLDLGIGQATARFVAATDAGAQRRAVVATSVAVLCLAGAGGIVIGLALAALSPVLFGDIPGLRGALTVAAVSTGLQVPLNVFGNALFGAGRIVARNAFIVARMVGSGAAIVVAIEAGGGLLAFVVAQAGAELAVMIAQAAWARARVEGLDASPRDANRDRLREVTAFSFAVLGLMVATQLAFYSDGIVIGAIIGTTAVAVYTVAMRIVEGASQLLSQFADVFLPVFSRLDAGGQLERARTVFHGGTRATLLVGYPLIALLCGLGGPLVRLWVPGDEFQAAWTPLALLAGALACTAPLRFGILWAIGAARHHRIAVYAVLDAMANIGISIALAGPLGIDGVALATFVTLAVSNGWLIPREVCKGLGLRLWSGYLRRVLVAALVATPVALLARLVVAPAVDGSWPLTLAASAGVLVLAGGSVAAVVLEPSDRTRLRARAAALRST